MRFVSIASGSSGNCIYVGSDNSHLLIDAGISGKRIEQGLNEIGIKGPELDGILITTIEPILNPIWVFLLIGEVPGAYALMGGAIVLGAILLRGYLAKEQYA